MRALFAVLLLLALTVVFLPHSATAATDCQRATCSASFERTISTNAWGVTTISDYVNLTSTVPVTHLTIGIPASVSDDLRFTVATAQGVNLQVSNSLSIRRSPAEPSPVPCLALARIIVLDRVHLALATRLCGKLLSLRQRLRMC